MNLEMVFAGNYQQFMNYKRLHKNPDSLRYIADALSLKGFHGYSVTTVGTWYERSDRDEIEQELTYERFRQTPTVDW